MASSLPLPGGHSQSCALMWDRLQPVMASVAHRLRAPYVPSPDVRLRPPGSGSLDSDCASASCLRLSAYAGERDTGSPKPPQRVGGGFGGVGERFPNEGRRGLSENLKDRAAATFAAPPKPDWARCGTNDRPLRWSRILPAPTQCWVNQERDRLKPVLHMTSTRPSASGPGASCGLPWRRLLSACRSAGMARRSYAGPGCPPRRRAPPAA